MKLPKKGRLVIVKWRDAAHDGAWSVTPDNDELAVCTSVGYLVAQDKERIVLAAARNEAGQVALRGVIARGDITDIRKLNIGKRP